MGKKIAVLIGTRPGIVKMSPLIHELKSRSIDHIVIHSGQHYSREMDEDIMKGVGLSSPDYHVNREESWVTHAQQTAYMLTAIEEILLKEQPDVLLVCGDANTNMAGALAARKIHIKVGHVESGLRSFDWRMPEEHNRVIIDHISDYLFAPTEQSKQYLIDDGIKGQIFVVGNTIVDATMSAVNRMKNEISQKVTNLVGEKDYSILTLHREENVDNKTNLKSILNAIIEISNLDDRTIIFPMHPRTWKMVTRFGFTSLLDQIKNIKILTPLPYMDFLSILSQAKLILTDSGGLQEESCILNVPCITLRENTERPETVQVKANCIAGTSTEKIVSSYREIVYNTKRASTWPNPYGDGRTASRIIDICLYEKPKDEFLFKAEG
jgi:UDP-N-acetylglucosamine 2-epimerase (non-hydrolysing)